MAVRNSKNLSTCHTGEASQVPGIGLPAARITGTAMLHEDISQLNCHSLGVKSEALKPGMLWLPEKQQFNANGLETLWPSNPGKLSQVCERLQCHTSMLRTDSRNEAGIGQMRLLMACKSTESRQSSHHSYKRQACHGSGADSPG